MAAAKLAMYLYFAYGSNLLSSRMHIENPAARRAGIARLDDHRLDFNFESSRWGGFASTIVPHKGRHVWGALWEISDLDSLDRQEGVHENIYEVRNVSVIKPDNSSVACRTYQLVVLPEEEFKRKPSRPYLETILQGAVESQLPLDYLNWLRTIVHDGFEGPLRMNGFKIDFVETKPLNSTTVS